MLLDAVVAALLGLWLAGGVSWHGQLILRHGADPRRAAVLVAVAAAGLWPVLWDRSYALRGARAVWRGLETGKGRRIALLSGFALASVIGILQTMALRVTMYDVGIFHQILWALAHGYGFVSTISGAGNFLLDHLSPSLALLVPAFWISGSSPLALAVLHPALLFAGAAAWVWLAENLGASPVLPAAATLFALTFDSLWGNLHWGFHENAIGFAALSWAFALVLARPGRKLLILALFLIAAGSKEILLVDVALALLVWAFIERRNSRIFSLKLLLFAAGLLAAFVWFELQPHPADKNYFDRYYAYLGHGLGDFFKALLLSPWVVIQTVGARELLRYFMTVLLPWIFLPLVAFKFAKKEALWLIAILPSLASAGLATFSPLRGSGFHYVLELWPALAALSLLVLSRLPARFASRVAVAWALLAVLAWDHDPWGDLRDYGQGAFENATVRRAMSEIPNDASVMASDLSGTWLSARLQITRYPELPFSHCPQWLILNAASEVEKVRQICPPDTTRVVGDWSFVQTRTL